MVNKGVFIKFLMDSGVLKFGDFTTKSGRKSPYFINMGDFDKGDQLSRLGRFYGECIVENIEKGNIAEDVNVLFGPAYKGIPLSVATAMALSDNFNKSLNYCFNRKEEKDHGEGGSFVGHKLKDGDKILIIEDVITAGTAVREILPLLKKAANVEIHGLIIAVDRMEKGKDDRTAVEEIYEEYGIKTFPIVNIKEILGYMAAENAVGNKKLQADLKSYMDQYCVI